MPHSTDEESFWAGAFGDAYTERNRGEQLLAAKAALFSRVLARTRGINSVIELGANIGLNLLALKTSLPQARFEAVEINETAFAQLSKIEGVSRRRGVRLS
jgi:predicted O-methyltransferase YrrM